MSFRLLPLSRLPGAYIRFHYNTLEDICQPQGMVKNAVQVSLYGKILYAKHP